MPTQPKPHGWCFASGSPVVRGYDTSALHWKDEILRIRHLEAEIAAMQKEIERLKEKAVAAEERFQRLKTEMGITG